jgi:hypothetical protein
MKMRMKKVVLDMNALKRLCLDYDFCKGRYPESLYEGYSLYAHYLKNNDGIISVTEAEWMEEAKKQMENSEGGNR